MCALPLLPPPIRVRQKHHSLAPDVHGIVQSVSARSCYTCARLYHALMDVTDVRRVTMRRVSVAVRMDSSTPAQSLRDADHEGSLELATLPNHALPMTERPLNELQHDATNTRCSCESSCLGSCNARGMCCSTLMMEPPMPAASNCASFDCRSLAEA